MNEASYTYAVARIRANEPGLLGAADMEQLLSAPDLAAAESLLSARGYDLSQGLDAALRARTAQAWRLITEILPRPGELDFLVVKNDFHNLKARLKAMFAHGAPRAPLLSPTAFGDGEIAALVEARRFGGLPECMAGCAQEAYDLLARTMDGHLADTAVDRQCLATIPAMARATGSEFLLGLAETMCASIGRAAELRAQHKSSAAFEKQCDDALIEYALPAKWKHFGVEPVAAYWLAREAEVKNVRIAMACRRNGVPAEEIRERVRLLYV
ncbi:MAG: V-type ATPase subunit [Oscillospiraceae bacterium]|jgi:V/A-type H+-transporting ATPase subunit C|nr:V-type ATPase subunit [Oscillospiraceae bacterium]